MNVNEFQQYVGEHTWEGKDIYFTSNALGGELGELQNVIKKEQAYNDFPPYKAYFDKGVKEGTRPTFQEHFIDEAGDVLFYFLQMLNKKGVTLQEVIDMQVEKNEKLSVQHKEIYQK